MNPNQPSQTGASGQPPTGFPGMPFPMMPGMPGMPPMMPGMPFPPPGMVLPGMTPATPTSASASAGTSSGASTGAAADPKSAQAMAQQLLAQLPPAALAAFAAAAAKQSGAPPASIPGAVPGMNIPFPPQRTVPVSSIPGAVPGMNLAFPQVGAYPGMPMYPPGSMAAMMPGSAMPAAQAPAPKKPEVPMPDVPRCHLHNKPQPYTCRFCKRWKEGLKLQAKAKAERIEQMASENADVMEVTNTKSFNIHTVLADHILKCGYFKNTLVNIDDFDQVVDEIYNHCDHAEPYSQSSTILPSSLFCALYKVFTMRLTEQQLRKLCDHVDSPYIRCVGFLYIRYGFHAERMWDWYKDYFCDETVFTPGIDKDRSMTIGEYCETLLTEEKYFSTMLPRLPVKYKTQFGLKLMIVDEFRKRARSNKKNIDLYRGSNCRVEVRTATDWQEGTVLEILEEIPTRIMMRVRMDSGSEEVVSIGYIITTEPRHERSRSRSRRRGRSPDTDWCRSRGTAEEDLHDKFVERQRSQAVASGKDYARPVAGFKKALQTKMELNAARREGRRSRSPSPRGGRSRSTRGIEDTKSSEIDRYAQQKKMAELMERYGPQAGVGNYGAKPKPQKNNDLLGPDVMRLG